MFSMVPGAGLEPARCLAPADFESAASTNFATPAVKEELNYGTVFPLIQLRIPQNAIISNKVSTNHLNRYAIPNS